METNEKDARGRPRLVPRRVRVLRTVRSDLIHLSRALGKEPLVARPGEYEVGCNQFGAVYVEVGLDGEKLGLKPAEFEVLEWTENEHYER